jgi:hypothetical protein
VDIERFSLQTANTEKTMKSIMSLNGIITKLALSILVTSLWPAGAKAPLRTFTTREASAQTPLVELSVDPSRVGLMIPRDFVGLSFEENDSLSSQQFYNPASAKSLAALMNRLGDGQLRLGGASSDDANWNPTDAELRALGTFMSSVPGWRLIFGLNMGKTDVASVANVAKKVSEAVPLVTFQLGNEPDQYARQGSRAKSYSESDYIREWNARYDAVTDAVPNAQFAGPDVALTNLWLKGLVAAEETRLASASRHYYPFCAGKDATIQRLLDSDRGYPAEAATEDVAVAKSAQLTLRLTEMNSICGGGQDGVSNTLASALWGVEAMMQFAQLGVAGINLHSGRVPAMYYTPVLQSADKSFIPQPTYYSLLLFSQIEGMKIIALSPSRVTGEYAFLALIGKDSHVRILVVNKDTERHLQLRVSVGPRLWESATVLTLTGSHADSHDVTLGGAVVNDDGSWKPTVNVLSKNGPIAVPPFSAALIELF